MPKTTEEEFKQTRWMPVLTKDNISAPWIRVMYKNHAILDAIAIAPVSRECLRLDGRVVPFDACEELETDNLDAGVGDDWAVLRELFLLKDVMENTEPWDD